MINSSVLYLIIPLASGIIAGYLSRGNRRIDISRASVTIVLVLVFSLGFSMGANSELLNSLPIVGVSALAMASLAIAFSVLFTVLARRKLKV